MTDGSFLELHLYSIPLVNEMAYYRENFGHMYIFFDTENEQRLKIESKLARVKMNGSMQGIVYLCIPLR